MKYPYFKRAALMLIPFLCATELMAAELEEVIVTAQHREQNIQDVPITVTALGADELAVADIFDAGSIALHVPGMAYAEFAPGQAIISMRGVSSADDGAGLDNSVAVFLDGVYIGRQAAINFNMFDLDRIEVLKGPQGTLFGRNAIGGAINVVTLKPSDEFVSKIGATVGNEGILRYRAYVSGPFSDSVAGKISIDHREHDGYVENVLLGTDLQNEDQTSIRGQLRFASDSSEWLLSADYMEDDRDDMGRTPVETNTETRQSVEIAAANGVSGPRQNAATYDGYSEREASGFSLQGDIELGGGTLTTITALRNAKTDWEMQSVGSGLGGNVVDGNRVGVDEVIDDILEDIDTFSQELRWVASPNDTVNYTVGLYYFTEDTDRIEQFKVTRAGTYEGDSQVLTVVGPQDVIGNEYTRTENETTSYAAYGQATWDFGNAWSFSLGARYTVDKKDYSATAVNCSARVGTAFENLPECEGIGRSLRIITETFMVTPSDDWNDFSPMASLQYRPTADTMLFGAVSKGFKSGGFAGSQGIESRASAPVEPESALNYELGFKGDLANNTLRLNITAFFTDYEDLQVVRFGPGAANDPDSFGTFVTTNIGTADILGLETDFIWNITDNFSLSGNYAWLDTEVDGLALELVVPGTTTRVDQDLSGSDLRQAPKHSWNLVAGYALPLASGSSVDFRLEFSHVDRQITDYVNQLTRVDEHDLLDARIAWTSSGEKLEIALWGKNLNEEDYISHSYTIGPGVIGVWGAPRTIGLTATYGGL